MAGDKINIKLNFKRSSFFMGKILNFYKKSALILTLTLSASFAVAQSLESLIGNFYSRDCNSSETTVSTFLKSSSQNSNYSFVSYNNKQEVIKSVGFAKSNQNGTALILIERNSAFDEKGAIINGFTHWIVSPQANKYAILYNADNKVLSIENGQDVYTKEIEERFKCRADSPAVKSAIGNINGNQITKKLPLPASPDEATRNKIENQQVSVNTAWIKVQELVRENSALTKGKSNLESFIALPLSCNLFRRIVVEAEAAVKIDSSLNSTLVELKNARNEVCSLVNTTAINFEKDVAAAKKNPKLIDELDCLDASVAEKMKAGGWPQDSINSIMNSSRESCRLINQKKSAKSEVNKSGPNIDAALLDFMKNNCKKYQQAEVKCATAANFNQCIDILAPGVRNYPIDNCALMFGR
jgi:hypothetical protein